MKFWPKLLVEASDSLHRSPLRELCRVSMHSEDEAVASQLPKPRELFCKAAPAGDVSLWHKCRVFLNLGFAKPMFCNSVLFHENDGNHENDENDEDNSDSHKQWG